MNTERKTRAGKPKSRTGCRTCKSRRVKCDEQKPHCKRCVSTGRQCSGYDTPKTTSRNPQNHRPIVPLVENSTTNTPKPPSRIQTPSHWETHYIESTESSLILSRPSAHILSRNSHEFRAYDFFRVRSKFELPGILHSNLWSHLLQLSHSEPAIHHAVIALGSLHERMEKRQMPFQKAVVEDMSDPAYRFSLQQHNAAVHHVYTRLHSKDRQSIVVALTTCYLFVCFDLLRNRPKDAMVHLQSGLSILLGMMSTRKLPSTSSVLISTTPHSIEEDLIDSFCRLDLQATNSGLKTLGFTISVQGRHGADKDWHPDTFTSLLEAQQYLWEHMNSTAQSFNMRTLLGVGADDYQTPEKLFERDRILSRYSAWGAALDSFLKREAEHLDSRELLLADVLRVQYLYMVIIINCGTAGGVEMVSDQFIPQFKTVVSLVEEIFKRPERPKSFQVDFGPQAMLFYAALKCRDPATRHRALDVMLSEHRREGLCDSLIMGSFVAAVVEIEERGYEHIKEASELPESARICGTEGDLNEDQTMLNLRCRRKVPDSDKWHEWTETVPIKAINTLV